MRRSRLPPRDLGRTWSQRLAAERARRARPRPELSADDVADLFRSAEAVDVTPRRHRALLWSGKDVPTIEPLHAGAEDGPRWLDKYSVQEAAVFRALGLAVAVEDTPGGRHFLELGLDYPDDHALASVARHLWDLLSRRFAAAASGRVEVLVEGALPDSVFRNVELGALLANPQVACINGLDRRHFPDQAGEAFFVLRRWDVERAGRYSAWVDRRGDADAREREAARDDAREAELWFAQDFFEALGPQGRLPELPEGLRAAVDRTRAARGWKYSPRFRAWRRA